MDLKYTTQIERTHLSIKNNPRTIEDPYLLTIKLQEFFPQLNNIISIYNINISYLLFEKKESNSELNNNNDLTKSNEIETNIKIEFDQSLNS
jgi:hypothetical protein